MMTLVLLLPAKKKNWELSSVTFVCWECIQLWIYVFTKVDECNAANAWLRRNINENQQRISLVLLFLNGNNDFSCAVSWITGDFDSYESGDNKLWTILKIEIAYTLRSMTIYLPSSGYRFVEDKSQPNSIDNKKKSASMVFKGISHVTVVNRVTVDSFLHTIYNMKISTDFSFWTIRMRILFNDMIISCG